MKHVLIAAATIGIAAVAWTTPGTAATAGKCLPKETKIQGQTAIVNCGSATATVRYKGKRYAFKSGSCLRTGKTIMLDLGTNFIGGNNHGYAHFSLMVLSATAAPVLATSGKVTINGTAKLSSTGARGTFKGTNTIVHGTTITNASFSGSWNCGAVYQF